MIYKNSITTLTNTSKTTCYTCTNGKRCIVTSIVLSNIDGSTAVDATVDIGDISAATDYVFADEFPIQPNSNVELLSRDIVLEQMDTIKVTASVANDLNVFISVQETE